MVAARSLEEEAAFGGLLLHTLARSGLIAGAVGSEAVVAVGDNGSHGKRLRTLALEALDLRV